MAGNPPPPPGFDLDDAPPPPPGFSVDQPVAKASTTPQSLAGEIIVRPIDGDTGKLSSGQSLRLWGIDAPEMSQQGWDRSGRAVPIGEQSRDAFGGLLGQGTHAIGSPVGMSYRRPVAPLEVGGEDAGLALARYGNALAAPEFLGADPQRRFEYMQAERLARLNGLGIHDTKFQAPDEYRKEPLPAPSRETVAQWWDTPTPMAGMRPEVEQTFLGMINDPSVPVEKVVQFSKDNGFITDPADVTRAREQIEKTGLAATIGYQEHIRPLTDLGDGAVGAFVRGAGSGILASGLDEAGALVDTLGGTEGRENLWNSDRRFADIWSNNQQQNASILGFDDYEHPYATTGGELAGGLLVPFGARARTVGELASVGAAYGGATGFLGTDGSASERALGAAVGVPLGAVVGATGGKVLEYAAPRVGRLAGRLFGRGADDAARATGAGDDLVPQGGHDVPAPPPGYALDDVAIPMAADPTPSISQDVRQPDYLSMERPQPVDQALSGQRMQDLTNDIQPRDVLPMPVSDEWPAGGPDFAGNINLRNLDTPQDITRALTTVEREIGFDAATRGRVTQEETARLAADLNMTPDTLMARRNGQAFNAEEALAARQILAKSGNELVNAAKRIQEMENPGDELLAEFRQKLVRHAAIQEQVSGATAEAGRALAQFRMMADSRAVKGNVLSAIVHGGGGSDGLKDVADIIVNSADDPQLLNRLSRQATKPRLRDKLVELWYNSLLSGPQTHAVNMVSNTLTSLAQIPEHALAAGVGAIRQAAPRANPDRILFSEVGSRAFGLLQGAKDGIRQAARTALTGETSDLVSKVESQSQHAISGLKGSVIRTPTRMLAAEDELFKAMARRMEMSGLAIRTAASEGLKGRAAQERVAELMADPTDKMLARASDYAQYLTFQRPLGPVGQKISQITQEFPALKLFLPFIRTPTNLLKFSLERSPAAPFLKEWRAEYAAGGAKRDMAIARALAGTGVGMAVMEAAGQGHLSGNGPADDGAKALLQADGWQPYSIRVGDKYYSYQRMDPFSSTLGVAADMVELQDYMTDKQRDKVATLITASVMQNIANKTWLSGLSGMLEAMSDPDRKADALIKRLAGSIAVPAGVAQAARTTDPTLRQAETILDAVRNRVPGLSQGLEPRRDAWGQPIRSEGGVGPDLVSPLWQSTRRNDPVNNLLLEAGAHISRPQREVGGRKLTLPEYGRYQELSGTLANSQLRELINAGEWAKMSRDDQQDLVSEIMRGARRDARRELFPEASGR